MAGKAAGGRWDRLRTMFPDREFFMRSQGQVRFIKVTTRMQVIAASAVTLLASFWLISMGVMGILQFASTRDRMDLLDREAKVETAESRVAAYRKNLDSVASDLDRRQDVIERLVQAHIGDLPQDEAVGDTVSNSANASAATVRKVSAALPEATGLARIEARQLAFIERLTRFADRRAARDSEAIRGVGLDPSLMLASLDDRTAQGGPYVGLATAANGSLDPRFQRLGASLARMSAIAQGLAGIPHALPASLDFISSGFGYRSDPFNGSAAFHAGLDFKGPYGAPIYAAARGVVSFVGQKQGYGNCVEVDHGNGLMTRYAHMSAFRAKVGSSVGPGDVIGAIGSSGRSTGPHLHFEVRIHDRPVNPKPFLEAATHVFQETDNAAGGRR